jgi:DNA polymerase III alpha subunit
VAYTFIGYQMAYLKANFRAEFEYKARPVKPLEQE